MKPTVFLKDFQSSADENRLTINRIKSSGHRSKNHVKAHLEFAKKHNGDPFAMWVMILWSDETKIELFNQISKRCLRRNLLLFTPQKIYQNVERKWEDQTNHKLIKYVYTTIKSRVSEHY